MLSALPNDPYGMHAVGGAGGFLGARIDAHWGQWLKSAGRSQSRPILLVP